MTDFPVTHEWSTFHATSADDIRADMQEEHNHAIEAGIDPMDLYRGHLTRARMLKEIIDKEQNR